MSLYRPILRQKYIFLHNSTSFAEILINPHDLKIRKTDGELLINSTLVHKIFYFVIPVV